MRRVTPYSDAATPASSSAVTARPDRGNSEQRIPDPEDKRAKLICLTERGKEAQRFGFALFSDLEERWAERFGSGRVAGLRGLLEEIAADEIPEALVSAER